MDFIFLYRLYKKIKKYYSVEQWFCKYFYLSYGKILPIKESINILVDWVTAGASLILELVLLLSNRKLLMQCVLT